jgi:hypothetical protein
LGSGRKFKLMVRVFVGVLGKAAAETGNPEKQLVISEQDLKVEREGVWNVKNGELGIV